MIPPLAPRALGAEQDVALALAPSTGPERRGRLLIAGRSRADIVSGPGREDSLARPVGVPVAALAAASDDAGR